MEKEVPHFFVFNEALRGFHTFIYITVTSQGEENLKNQENSRFRTPSFLFVWSSDLGLSTLGCDS
jgi:hypothetical protein